jgi:hypothetical protein
METNNERIDYTKIDLKDFTKYSIFSGKDTLLQLDIYKNSSELFENFLVTQISLYKKSSELLDIILRYVEPSWLIPDKNFDYKRSIVPDLFLSYFSRKHDPYGYNVDDTCFRRALEHYQTSNNIQDEELLYDLANGIVFFDSKNQIRLNNINGTFFSLAQEEYVRILDVVKKQFGISTSGIVDIDDLLQEAVDIFLSRILNVEGYAISEQSYLSQDHLSFKEKILSSINDEKKNCSCKDVLHIKGYMIELKGSVSNPCLSLSPLSIISVYQGLPPVLQEYKKVLAFKGDDFWDLAWGELARKHEERLLQENCKMEIGAKCSDKYDATLGEIRVAFAKQQGIELTESSLGQITKKALAKIREEFEKRNISYEDYADCLDNSDRNRFS